MRQLQALGRSMSSRAMRRAVGRSSARCLTTAGPRPLQRAVRQNASACNSGQRMRRGGRARARCALSRRRRRALPRAMVGCPRDVSGRTPAPSPDPGLDRVGGPFARRLRDHVSGSSVCRSATGARGRQAPGCGWRSTRVRARWRRHLLLGEQRKWATRRCHARLPTLCSARPRSWASDYRPAAERRPAYLV